MTYMGIDLGDARTGIAFSESGILARGELLIEGLGLRRTAARIAELAVERQVGTIVLGDPLHTDGQAGERSEKIHAFANLLRGQLIHLGLGEIPIIFQNESLTSVEAHELLAAQGNDSMGHRTKVDMLAAELILADYLEENKNREKR